MPALGVVLIWAGYTFGIFGFAKIQTALGSPKLSLSDVALPSHRATYLAAAATWGTNGGGVPGSAAVSGAPAVNNGSGDAQSQGVTVVQPTGGKDSLKGVDLNGNTYTRTCPTCAWKLNQNTGQVGRGAAPTEV
jgi:hypothetical protein